MKPNYPNSSAQLRTQYLGCAVLYNDYVLLLVSQLALSFCCHDAFIYGLDAVLFYGFAPGSARGLFSYGSCTVFVRLSHGSRTVLVWSSVRFSYGFRTAFARFSYGFRTPFVRLSYGFWYGFRTVFVRFSYGFVRFTVFVRFRTVFVRFSYGFCTVCPPAGPTSLSIRALHCLPLEAKHDPAYSVSFACHQVKAQRRPCPLKYHMLVIRPLVWPGHARFLARITH